MICGGLKPVNGEYQISTKDQLYWFAALVNGTGGLTRNSSAKGVLKADIQVDSGWKPIGSSGFTGSLNGQNHTVTIPAGISLFDKIESGATVSKVSVSGGNLCNSNSGTIANCCVSGTGSVKLCGSNTGTIKHCYAAGDSGTTLASGGTITNCYVKAGTSESAVYGTSITQGDFGIGKVAYLLNEDGCWGQTVYSGTTDSLPKLGGKTVYYKEGGSPEYHNHNGYCNICLKRPSNSDGTSGNWLISNVDELYWFAQLINGDLTATNGYSKNAVLTADITVNTGVLNPDGTLNESVKDSLMKWTPIGKDENNSNTVQFNGQGHTISGLYCDYSWNAGLFGYLYSSTIQNVIISDSYFSGGRVGGVCGMMDASTITNCFSSSMVTGDTNVGGICGRLVGMINAGTISNCASSGRVNYTSRYDNGGGVCGSSGSLGTITSCYYDKDKYTGNAIGSGTGTNVEGKTTKEFASGEVAYLLNGSTNAGTWKQNIDKAGASRDETPNFTGAAVYQATSGECLPGYTNNTSLVKNHVFEDHICVFCDKRDQSPITVSGITAKTKTYDGTTSATLDCSKAVLTNTVTGQRVTEISVTATGTFDKADAGARTVTIRNLKLTGADAGKYYLAESGQQTTATATISPKNITVTITANGGTYGNVTAATAKPNNVVSGQTVPVTLTYTGTANDGTGYSGTTAPAKAGTYTVTASINSSNYSLTGTITAEFKIEKATVTTPKLESKDYTGQTLTADVPASDRYTVKTNVGGTNVNASGYPVELQLTDSNNYTWDAQGGQTSFMIKKAANQWTATPTITGWTYGENASNPTMGSAKFGEAQVTYLKGEEPLSGVPTNAGSYTARFTVAETTNYGSLTKDVPFTISPKPVTVSGITAEDKTYDGEKTATLKYDGVTFTGKLESDSLSVEGTGEFENANVGESKTVNITNLTLGGDSKDNYTLSSTTATATASISVLEIEKPAADSKAFTYTGSEQTYTLTTNKWYTITGNTQTAAGEHEVTVALKDKQNTQWKDGTTGDLTFSFVIAKAASSVTTDPKDAKSLYSGVDVPLVTEGTAQGGTMMYRLGENSQWSEELPQAAAHGEYTVYYYVKGDGNHEDTAEKSLKARILPFQIPLQPQRQDIDYGKDATLSVGLNTKVTEGISYQWCLVTREDSKEIFTPLEGKTGSELTLTKPNAGKYEYACIVTCGDYSETSAKATVTVTPVDIPVDSGTGIDLSGFWLEGGEAPASENQTKIPEKSPSSRLLTKYTYNGTSNDAHQNYPTGMEIYSVETDDQGNTTVAPVAELGNLLRYSGCSIRITGKPGIRMITSLTKEAKAALTKANLAGYTLEEYGTVAVWSTDLDNQPLTLNTKKSRSNYAYKRGVSDPVFANVGALTQYTNVLVWDSLEAKKYDEDIVMRPYIKLINKDGETVTLYGGTVSRSIGYVAQQNANTFAKGTAGYKYVHEIIDKVNALHSSTGTNTTTGGNG